MPYTYTMLAALQKCLQYR